jgi:hypothetical protein
MKASAQVVSLAGSDSWEPVIRLGFLTDPTRAPGADIASFLAYSGGGQTPGETALKTASTNQVIAVFTQQLTDSGTGSVCATNPGAQDIVIGVDGILNVANASHFSGNPQVSSALGGSSPTANVISILYTGFDFSNAGAGNDCNGNTRRALLSNYASVFSGSSIPANTPIKHLYRRGDASATSKSFLQLLGIPTANQKYCNGTDSQDLDPIRRQVGTAEQVAEFDGTLGVVLPIVIPTFSNLATDLYTGANGTSPAAFGKFAGGPSPSCASGPSSTDPSSAGAGSAAGPYAGLASPAPATLPNTPRCDCRYPVPANFADPNSSDAKRFNWNVKLGIGCQSAQASASPAWNVLNGDDGTRENTPAAWGTRINTTLSPLPAAQRCCNVGTPAGFRREDPRLLNLFLRDPATGALRPSATAPVYAFYRLATTDKGLSAVGKTGFVSRCQQSIASDLQVSCLVTSVPGDVDSLGVGALPVFKDAAANGLPVPTPLNLNSDPTGSNFASIRNRSYQLSRYVMLSSLKGFNALGESATAHTGNPASYNYDHAAGATQGQVDAQWNLAKALFTDSRRSDRSNAAVERFGFLALAAGTDPYAVACTDDANSPSAPHVTPALDTSTYFGK